MNVITYEERADIYRDALELYGPLTQLVVALEELSELQKEVCKAIRQDVRPEGLAEEIADATIMLEQLRQIFGINDQVCKAMDSKVMRLRKRIQDDKGREAELARLRAKFANN